MTVEAKPVAWARSDRFTIHYWSSSEKPANSTGDIDEWKPLYSGSDYLSAFSEAAALRGEVERLRKAVSPLVDRAAGINRLAESRTMSSANFQLNVIADQARELVEALSALGSTS